MNQAIVLCYNMQGERAEMISALAMKQGIRPHFVKAGEYQETLAALCGLEPVKGGDFKGDGFLDEMMVMAFLKKGMLNRFLDSFRESGAPSVPLKAMLTENNSRWDSLTLHHELMQEYEYFSRMQAQGNGQ